MASFTVAMKSGKRSSEKIFHGRKAQSHNAATTHSAMRMHHRHCHRNGQQGYQPLR